MSVRPSSLHHVSRTPRAPGSAPHPLLLLLHGYGADENDLLALADELDDQYFVVSARAPISLGGGYAWYHLSQDPTGAIIPDHATILANLELLKRFIGEVARAYPIDPTRIDTLGFSQGAVMAGALLLTEPALPRRTVMLSGYLPLDAVTPAPQPDLRDQAVFVGHGLLDPLVPIGAGRLTRDYFQRVGADLTYREYPIGHTISPDELASVAGWLGTEGPR